VRQVAVGLHVVEVEADHEVVLGKYGHDGRTVEKASKRSSKPQALGSPTMGLNSERFAGSHSRCWVRNGYTSRRRM